MRRQEPSAGRAPPESGTFDAPQFGQEGSKGTAMEPKAQDGHDAITHEPTDELTGEQVEQVSGGLAKIGIGVPTL